MKVDQNKYFLQYFLRTEIQDSSAVLSVFSNQLAIVFWNKDWFKLKVNILNYFYILVEFSQFLNYM